MGSYAGYVELPPSQGRNYTSHTFFWLVAHCSLLIPSRRNLIVPTRRFFEARRSPEKAPLILWLSYSTLRNVTWIPSAGDLGETRFLRPEEEREAVQNETVLVGTASDRLAATTVNSTGNAMRAMWDFLQVWLADFPGYKTSNDQVSVWGESVSGVNVTFSHC